MQYEPSLLEITMTRIAFLLYGKSIYRTFADRLPLKGEERVLDFGCRMGTVAYYVAQRLPQGHLTCMDISRRWLNACRKTLGRYGNVTYQQWECKEFAVESFDIVYCHFVMHDVPESELKVVIPALVKCLKPGGVLVFWEPLRERDKISSIKRLFKQNRLLHKESRITDIPILGNALESVYLK
ncbi:MAG: class I SAM-dependent methyltransferase [Syntrophomonadaceae bacterium]